MFFLRYWGKVGGRFLMCSYLSGQSWSNPNSWLLIYFYLYPSSKLRSFQTPSTNLHRFCSSLADYSRPIWVIIPLIPIIFQPSFLSNPTFNYSFHLGKVPEPWSNTNIVPVWQPCVALPQFNWNQIENPYHSLYLSPLFPPTPESIHPFYSIPFTAEPSQPRTLSKVW